MIKSRKIIPIANAIKFVSITTSMILIAFAYLLHLFEHGRLKPKKNKPK
jgi:hypothetical protein